MAMPTFDHEAVGEADVESRAGNTLRQPGRLFLTAREYVTLLLFLAICSGAAYFYRIATTVAYPYELDYGEGIVLWQAAHVSTLATAYHPITQYPYIVFHYPPVYHAVSLAVSKVTGDLLLAGRLVSLLSTLGICLTLAWIVHRSLPARAPGMAKWGGATFAGALPCGLKTLDWAQLMRVDMLALWLTFAGLALFILGRSSRWRYAAFVLFIAALYTRQTLIAGPLACLVVAAILNVRQAIKLLGFAVALGAAVMAWLMLATHGQIMLHIFLYNQNPFSFRRAITYVDQNIQWTLPLLALAAAAAAGPLLDVAHAFSRRSLTPLRARAGTSTYRLALLTFTVHFIISAVLALAIGKVGSNINYFLECNLSACALAGLLVARLIWGSRRTAWASPVVAVAYLLPLLLIAQQAETGIHSMPAAASQERAEYIRNSEALVRILQASPEPVMSENMTLLYRAGKQVPFEPAIVAGLADVGTWDETPLIDMIRKRKFSVMIIRQLDGSLLYSPGVVSAIKENYHPAERYGGLTVYRPTV